MSNSDHGNDVPKVALLAMLALIGAAYFATSALLLPIYSEYDLLGDFISELAIGRYGFVQTLAFVALGLGSLALAAGIREATRGSRGSLVGSSLFGIFGVGVIVDAIFPIDRGGQMASVAGIVHLVAALVAFLCAIAAMFILSSTFKRDTRWRNYWSVSLALAFGALISLFLPSGGEWAGLFQRIFVGVIIAWMVFVALRLRVIAKQRRAQ